MPLAFDSTNKGRIAFGFFNIDIDLLLLEGLFFWAEDYCNNVIEAVKAAKNDGFQGAIRGWTIDHPADIGDLHSAIAGVNHTGFIGALYRLFPFPENAKDFKQQPDGAKNRGRVEELLERWARPVDIPISAEPHLTEVDVGGYLFDRSGFWALVDYVIRGGMPRWRDEVRPGYVNAMIEAITPDRAAG